jgi:hypothetical protein
MSKDLLKDAIADAKTLREVALSNAKAALEEAFTPKLKSILSKKIQAEADVLEDEEELDIEDGEELDVEDGEEEVEEEELDLDEILKELEDDEDLEIEDEEEELEADLDIEDGEDLEIEDDKGEVDLDIEDEEEELEEDEEEELDLESIIKELEDDEDEIELEDDEEEILDIEDDEVDLDIEDDEEELDLEDEEIDLDLNDDEDELDEIKAENKKLREAMKIIQSELNEIKLVNEKLLYINKVFKNNKLSESQKLKVVENFDRARNDREIKLVYTTIMEGFESVRRERITESITKKGLLKSTKPKTKIIKESAGDEFANRMKKLAGI